MTTLGAASVTLVGAPLPGPGPAAVCPARCGGAQAFAKSYPRPFDPQDALAWLGAELAVTSRVHHPAVIQAYGLWQGPDGAHHLVTQRPAGRRWDEIVRIGQQRHSYLAGRSWDDATQHVIRTVAHCVEAAHLAGVVHANLTPEAVWVHLTPAGDLLVQVGDFCGQALITPGPRVRFAAPEQLAGQGADIRTDVYRLGMLVYFTLTGTTPWPAEDPATARAARGVAVENLRDERSAAGWALLSQWPEVARTVQLALHPDPLRRPQSVAQFVSLLGMGWSLPPAQKGRDYAYALAAAVAAVAALAVSWPADDSRLTRALLDRQPLASCAVQLPVLAQQVCARHAATHPNCLQSLTFLIGREECPNRARQLQTCLGQP